MAGKKCPGCGRDTIVIISKENGVQCAATIQKDLFFL